MSPTPRRPGFTFSPSFVFRTPLLPLAELSSWTAAADRPGANEPELAAACDALRRRLRELVADPTLRDALFVASPDLDQSLPHWLEEPDSARGQKVERALVRYFSRMAARPTPFGLFSGVSVGALADRTELVVAPRDRYQRHTRLDNDYLFALCEELGRDPALRAALRYHVNSSLYAAAGRLRYAEARLAGKSRSHHLVAIEPTDYLVTTLERARDGATRGDLAASLVADDPEIALAEAEEFVDELIDSQILVSDLSPQVTGDEPIHGILDQLRALPPAAPVAERLELAQQRIEAIDRTGLGAAPAAYREIAELLGALPTKVELSRLFQVDMVKPAPDATLGRPVRDEIERGIAILHRMGRAPGESPLSRFRAAFSARYEDREVALVEVMDEEAGIGFDSAQGPSSEASPLLAGLAFPAPSGNPQTRWGDREVFLQRRLARLAAAGERTLALSDDDLEALSSPQPPPLPDAFATMVEIAARSPEALASGEFEILLEGGGGPSGARLSGRFCHASPAIHQGVLDHLRAEEALQPEAVFAEIAHLPEGRIGNILCRPVLRDYEIPYLGRSGAAADRLLPIDDLTVAVQGDRVVLRSRRLGRVVVPRLTTAHNFSVGSLGVYRFLCSLQSQDGVGFGWSWGAHDSAAFLPRVTCGKLVFSRARWSLSGPDLAPLHAVWRQGKTKTPADVRALRARVFDAAQELRRQHGLPDRVLLVDSDNELPVDFDNPLSVDSFAHLVKSRQQIQLREEFAGDDGLIASGPEGRFSCQVALSLVADRPPTTRRLPPPLPPLSRRFGPGSEWLYAKLYTGTSTADEVIRQLVAPLGRAAIACGAADQWFFLRYGDPDWHLRLRFHGDPARLHAEVAPRLTEGTNTLIDAGLLWRVQLDTYQREVERYGGPIGVELAERLFWADSEAIAAIVELLSGDAGADARWRLVVRGADMLLDDLGFDLAAKHTLMSRARDSMGREFSVDTGFARQLGARFRAERQSLFEMLSRDPATDAASELAPGYHILDQRSQALAPVVADLRRAEADGELSLPIVEMAWSYVHMHANRLLRSVARAQELVIYDFLKRYYESLIARARKKK